MSDKPKEQVPGTAGRRNSGDEMKKGKRGTYP